MYIKAIISLVLFALVFYTVDAAVAFARPSEGIDHFSNTL